MRSSTQRQQMLHASPVHSLHVHPVFLAVEVSYGDMLLLARQRAVPKFFLLVGTPLSVPSAGSLSSLLLTGKLEAVNPPLLDSPELTHTCLTEASPLLPLCFKNQSLLLVDGPKLSFPSACPQISVCSLSGTTMVDSFYWWTVLSL